MLIKIKDKETGYIYTNDMCFENKRAIIELHFCTSYVQALVQDTAEEGFTKDLFLPTNKGTLTWPDNHAKWIEEKP